MKAEADSIIASPGPRTVTARSTPQEQIVSLLPTVTATIVLLMAALVASWLQSPPEDAETKLGYAAFGVGGALYLAVFSGLYLSGKTRSPGYAWLNAVVSGTGLGLLHGFLPAQRLFVLGLLLVGATATSALVAGRGPSYVLIGLALALAALAPPNAMDDPYAAVFPAGALVICLAVTETIQQLKRMSRNQIQRLEVINTFSRQVSSSLDTRQVLVLLGEAFRHALQADTYCFGLRERDRIRFTLLYDEGEQFEDVEVDMEGTLSGWVLRHNRPLFLPDLRADVELPGVRDVVAGKNRTSLAWLGVPVRSESVAGVMAIASYRPHAFHESDLELLTNMAGHAALALDNAARHERLEAQAVLDSLTGAFNHGHFLKLLAECARDTAKQHQRLSLIMLDIDRFKQYNDTFGHLAGDEILRALCATIRSHLKRTDVLGRWGGEEFAIMLPQATGSQALLVAERIRTSMRHVKITDPGKRTFPAPTVSQGIAEYPTESQEVIGLVDLADRRLYQAKTRGRDQVEPDSRHWERLAGSKTDAAGGPPQAEAA